MQRSPSTLGMSSYYTNQNTSSNFNYNRHQTLTHSLSYTDTTTQPNSNYFGINSHLNNNNSKYCSFSTSGQDMNITNNSNQIHDISLNSSDSSDIQIVESNSNNNSPRPYNNNINKNLKDVVMHRFITTTGKLLFIF